MLIKKETHGEVLERKGLKKTKVRIALIQHFMKMEHAQSYSELQAAFKKEADKSTLYRNLSSFEKAGIIHRINDHSGIAKYAYGELPEKGKEHAHFVCDSCETVYCMEELTQVQLRIPKGFQSNQVQTIIRGICADC